VRHLCLNLLVKLLHVMQFCFVEQLALADMPTHFYDRLKVTLPTARQKFTMLSDGQHLNETKRCVRKDGMECDERGLTGKLTSRIGCAMRRHWLRINANEQLNGISTSEEFSDRWGHGQYSAVKGYGKAIGLAAEAGVNRQRVYWLRNATITLTQL